MTQSMTYSDQLKRWVRAGDLREQAESTWAKISAAIDRRDPADAASLASYSVDEGKFHVDTMIQWRAGLRALLRDKGLTEEELSAVEEGVLGLLAVPGEDTFDLFRHWDGMLELVQELQGAAYERRWDAAAALVEETREAWRVLCDRDVDWCCDLLNAAVEHSGETVVPEIWDRVLWPLFDSRYDRFDTDKADWTSESLPTLLYVALEAMRSYLSTPNRDGAPLELIEHDDRWVVRSTHADRAGARCGGSRSRMQRRRLRSRSTTA